MLFGDLNRQLVETIISKKRISLVGDNVNFNTTVRDERMTRHGKLHNFFRGAVLIHDLKFPNLSAQSPQLPISHLTASLFVPNVNEQELVNDHGDSCDDGDSCCCEVHVYGLFRMFGWHEQRPEVYTPQLAPKTEIIPLHFLPLNEMAKILTADVTMMEAVYQNAGVGKDDLPNILVGGISRHKTYQLM
jgi:hypothetical protein